MKRILFLLVIIAFITSCGDKTDATSSGNATPDSSNKPPANLPYTASYSSNFTADVSDADLKMVLMSYKDWADGNMTNLSKAMGDSVMVDFSNGDHFYGTNAELMKRWTTSRDSLISVTIDMQAWQRMYEPDKKDAAIITWYKEIDTYKTGKLIPLIILI